METTAITMRVQVQGGRRGQTYALKTKNKQTKTVSQKATNVLT